MTKYEIGQVLYIQVSWDDEFTKLTIISETPKAYIAYKIGSSEPLGSINKRSGLFKFEFDNVTRKCYTEQEKEDYIFVRKERYAISARVSVCQDANILRQIDALLKVESK